jgi:hypothetical protein
MTEKPHLAFWPAAGAVARCTFRTAVLLGQGRIHQPAEHVGRRIHFADGSSSTVYRETVLDRGPTVAPAVLVVGFRLRRVRHSWGHALFRRESLLNTLLFAGFPGLVSKLWLAHDGGGVYRGVYEWDGPELAESYVQALWWPLALASVPSSIHYAVLPGLGRDDVLRDPQVLDGLEPGSIPAWARITGVEAGTG